MDSYFKVDGEKYNAKQYISKKGKVNFKLSPNGEILIYFENDFKKITGLEVLKYPNSIQINYKIKLGTYSLADKEIPIDDVNPIYFQTKLNIENPIDHSKWLTPAKIDKLIKHF